MSSSRAGGSDLVRLPAWPVFVYQTPPLPEREAEDGVRRPEAQFEVQQANLEAARILQEAADAADAAAQEAAELVQQAKDEGGARAQAEFDLMMRRAELELDKAIVQAEAMRQTAAAEAKATRAEAEAEAQATLAKVRAEADVILAEAGRERDRRLDDAQDALVDLAVTAARRLVQGHLAIKPESVVRMVASGLRRLKEMDCTVRVHPNDLPLLEAQRHLLERELATGALHMLADSSLMPGDYLMASNQGQIDGRIEQQTEQLTVALKAALGG